MPITRVVVEEGHDNDARYGARMVLMLLGLAYNPTGIVASSKTNELTRQQLWAGAVSAVAAEKIRDVSRDDQDMASLAGIFDKRPHDPVISRQDLAEFMLDIEIQLADAPRLGADGGGVATAAEEETETCPLGLSLSEAEEVDISPEYESVEGLLAGLPNYNVKDVDLTHMQIRDLLEDGVPLARILDLSYYNESVDNLTRNAIAEKPDIVDRVIASTLRYAVDGRVKTFKRGDTRMDCGGSKGSGDRVVRLYYSRATDYRGLPLFVLFGAAHTKEDQGKLLRILTGNSKVTAADLT